MNFVKIEIAGLASVSEEKTKTMKGCDRIHPVTTLHGLLFALIRPISLFLQGIDCFSIKYYRYVLDILDTEEGYMKKLSNYFIKK